MTKLAIRDEVVTPKINSRSNFSILGHLGRLVFLLYEFVGITEWHVIPTKYLSEFKKLKLHGKQFNVPVAWKDYIEMRYGSDWENPRDRTEWFEDWRRSGNHIIEHRKLRVNLSFKKYWAGLL